MSGYLVSFLTAAPHINEFDPARREFFKTQQG
jgi:hypothetical protein